MVIWYILWPFGMYILWPFGIFCPVLVYCTKKNLATLGDTKIFLQVRDLQKKMTHLENELDITIEKLTTTTTKLVSGRNNSLGRFGQIFHNFWQHFRQFWAIFRQFWAYF
jgi:hypothetical protein